MATQALCLAQLGRLSLSPAKQTIHHVPKASIHVTANRAAKGFKPRMLSKAEKAAALTGIVAHKPVVKKKLKDTKKRKVSSTYKDYDMRDAVQFSLCDAMRYIRAFEVGRSPTSVKYEMALRMKSLKNGPVVRNRLRLPHPVKTDLRICVICPPDSIYAEKAKAAGASLVGEDEIFTAIKDGKIEFDRCIAQTDSLAKMNKAGLGRILGPRQLMPSSKMGTVVKDPSLVLKDLVGGSEYRERLGVVRMAVGQLGFTPEQMQRNVKAFIEAVKKDMAQISDTINKELAEVVLSSTNSPGFSLNGEFKSLKSDFEPAVLSTPF